MPVALHRQVIVGKEREMVLSAVEKLLNVKIIDLHPIRRKRRRIVYRVTCENNFMVRMDLYAGKVAKPEIPVHLLAMEHQLKIPSILVIFNVGKFICKISEWIKGTHLKGKTRRFKDVYLKAGELMGQMHTTEQDGLYLRNADFSPENLVWTGKELYFVDVSELTLTVKEQLDNETAFILACWIKEWRRVELFLESYKKYRDTANVVKLLELYERKCQSKAGPLEGKMYTGTDGLI